MSKKSILTIPLEGEILIHLEKVKTITSEVTSAGAIRRAIEMLPEMVDHIEKIETEIRGIEKQLYQKEEAVKIIMKSFKTLISKKQNP